MINHERHEISRNIMRMREGQLFVNKKISPLALPPSKKLYPFMIVEEVKI